MTRITVTPIINQALAIFQKLNSPINGDGRVKKWAIVQRIIVISSSELDAKLADFTDMTLLPEMTAWHSQLGPSQAVSGIPFSSELTKGKFQFSSADAVYGRCAMALQIVQTPERAASGELELIFSLKVAE